MYAEQGSIKYHAPTCHVCQSKMAFKQKEVNGVIIPCWECASRKPREHNTSVSMLSDMNTKYFRFLATTQLATFTKMLIYYMDPSPSIKAAALFCGIGLQLGYKWGLKIRELFGASRKFFHIELGDNGATLEMDGTHVQKKWKYHAMRMPKNWNSGHIWFRVIERDWTYKGRHRRLTCMVKSESVAECLPFIIANCRAGSNLMADGCGFGKSRRLNKLFKVGQCNHKQKLYVKPGTEHMNSHRKIHDNTVESSFQYDKILKSKSFGYGHRNVSNLMLTWMWESDWRNNWTSMETTDCVQTFFEHVGLIYSCN